jgi:PKD repeat protein
MRNKILLRNFLLILFTVILQQFAIAQNETNIWYFGYGAGLDFNSGSPVAITGGMVNTYEGCATICDANGDILFYSDGITVWNKNHQVMPNGSGLTGDFSSTQSATIIKEPGSTGIYYLFTTMSTLNYSIVDMSLNGGLGDINGSKNVFLATGAEKVCAVKHANGNDVWIIMHEPYTDGFNSFLLSSSGVNLVPVHSNAGMPDSGIVGQMKVSPLGNKIAVGHFRPGETVSLCDFDPATGIVSNGFPITTINSIQSYGVEFSPDGTRLYTTGENAWFSITQFDLTAGSPAAISASATIVGTTAGILPAGMQIGPDLKVYVTLNGANFLAVINDPNALGVACDFQDNAVPLGTGQCQLGLPGYMASYFVSNQLPNAIFTSPNHICPGTCTDFTNLSVNANTYIWNFPGANPAASTDFSPASICYNSPGQYDVQLIATNANGSDTLLLHNYITVYPYPAPQGILQNGDSLIANQGAVSYQWYHDGLLISGATEYFYVAPTGGNYNVVATDANGCEVEAVIFDVVAGISQLAVDNGQLAIFPNPVSESLTVIGYQLSGTSEKISIYNSIGEKVMEVTPVPFADKKEWHSDVSKLTGGIYWLNIIGSNSVSRIAFIKQ